MRTNADHHGPHEGLAADGLVPGRVWRAIVDNEMRATYVVADRQTVKGARTANWRPRDEVSGHPESAGAGTRAVSVRRGPGGETKRKNISWGLNLWRGKGMMQVGGHGPHSALRVMPPSDRSLPQAIPSRP